MTDSTTGPDGQKVRPLRPAEARTNNRKSGPPEGTADVSLGATSTDSVIGLREAGRSYAAIARQLTLPKAVHAQAAFVRAVRLRPEDERPGLVQREIGRLDVLEQQIRAGADEDPSRATRRLAALEKLRAALQ